ncbi:MAG: hypothetical protein M1536_06890 [Firmicutes bacterium]|nr:hypothetical protein [Bacillota bacterium]
MTKEDQEIRNKVIEAQFNDPALAAKMQEIDSKNLKRMKEIIKRFGWPGESLVGKDGADAAWLLVQHADKDIKFQKQCLVLIKEAVRKGEASKENLAYLTDRILVAERKKQIYGTQAQIIEGRVVFYPIEDEANIDARRKEIGLPTLEEYKKQLEKIYRLKNQAV